MSAQTLPQITGDKYKLLLLLKVPDIYLEVILAYLLPPLLPWSFIIISPFGTQ